jgi:hypothetical protein
MQGNTCEIETLLLAGSEKRQDASTLSVRSSEVVPNPILWQQTAEQLTTVICFVAGERRTVHC